MERLCCNIISQYAALIVAWSQIKWDYDFFIKKIYCEKNEGLNNANEGLNNASAKSMFQQEFTHCKLSSH
jgi:hypothetical protein